MLCFAILYCAMLCCAMLCYAVLCYAMLRYAMLCCTALCYAMLCYACRGPCGVRKLESNGRTARISASASISFPGSATFLVLVVIVLAAANVACVPAHLTPGTLQIHEPSRPVVKICPVEFYRPVPSKMVHPLPRPFPPRQLLMYLLFRPVFISPPPANKSKLSRPITILSLYDRP